MDEGGFRAVRMHQAAGIGQQGSQHQVRSCSERRGAALGRRAARKSGLVDEQEHGADLVTTPNVLQKPLAAIVDSRELATSIIDRATQALTSFARVFAR